MSHLNGTLEGGASASLNSSGECGQTSSVSSRVCGSRAVQGKAGGRGQIASMSSSKRQGQSRGGNLTG